MSKGTLLEEQSRIQEGRSCIHNVCTIKQTAENRTDYNLETRSLFIDSTEASDTVNR